MDGGWTEEKKYFVGTFYLFVHLRIAGQNRNQLKFEGHNMNNLPQSSLFSVRLAVALAAGLAVSTVNSQAQGVTASAQITGQSLGGGVFNYNVALDNTGTSSLETFWFAWNTIGYDFMTVSPTAITPASGWTASITSNFGGYGIQFNTSTTPLAIGSIINFSFDSTMTPTQMAGTSFLSLPVGTSYVSTAPFFGGTQSGSFVAQVVPEPSSIALFAVGSFGLWALRGRKYRGCALKEA